MYAMYSCMVWASNIVFCEHGPSQFTKCGTQNVVLKLWYDIDNMSVVSRFRSLTLYRFRSLGISLCRKGFKTAMYETPVKFQLTLMSYCWYPGIMQVLLTVLLQDFFIHFKVFWHCKFATFRLEHLLLCSNTSKSVSFNIR